MAQKTKKKGTVVAVSGGFDPMHVGHLRMITEAKKHGDYLVVILNNDHWLKKKKGFTFMPQDERAQILSSLDAVNEIMLTEHKPDDTDRSVCRELAKLKPDVFVNAGDRKNPADIPEAATCEEHNIKMVFLNFADLYHDNGEKRHSSSDIVNRAVRRRFITHRPWGYFEDIDGGKDWHLKTITINAGQRLSLQSHKQRNEVWTVIHGKIDVELRKSLKAKPVKKTLGPGDTLSVPKGMEHRVGSKKGAKFVEVSTGLFSEKDIVRYEDDYGRVGTTA